MRRPRLSLLVLAAPLVAAPLVGTPLVSLRSAVGFQAPFRVAPLRASGIYARGERAGWTVSLPTDAPRAAGAWTYSIRRNNAVEIAAGTLDLASGTATVAVAERAPAMLTMRLTPPGGATSVYGAAVAPRELRPVRPRPRDFDAFWTRKIAELRRIPENAVLTPGPSPREDVEYATIRMDHVNGTHVTGQIARPKRPGRYPAILQMQWAGGPYPLDPWWIVGRAAQGFLVLDIQAHDVLPTEPQAYYDALPAALKNYHTINQSDRERSYFVEMYLRDVRAADYLSHRPDWNGKVLVALGTSMGGQQAFAVAALHPKVTHMVANVPAGADLNAPTYGRSRGYPSFAADDPRAMETARYVDTINLAPRIRARSLVAMGFVDDVCPPAGVWTAFNLIRGPKEVAPMPDSPHNHLATPEQQRPFTSRSEEWLSALARGEDVRPLGPR